MTQTKQTFFLIILTALITAFCMYAFIGSPMKTDIATLQNHIKSVQNEEQVIDKKYKSTLTKLLKKNDSLQNLVSIHKAELAEANQKTSDLESEVSKLVVKVQAEPDTIKKKATDCDSLAKTARVLIQQYDTAQSICKQTVNELTEQLSNRDSADSLCNTSYTKMKLALDTSLVQQQDMVALVKSLNRKLNRKKFQSKFLSAGMLLLSGVAATLYIERRP